ncbi:filamin-binding LIM protein 1 [Aulostomus maculatus]
MASAASSKRMVSSVFITLSSPHQATMTQTNPPLQSNSSPARDKQQVRVNASDSIPSLRQKKADHSLTKSQSSAESKGHVGASPLASSALSPPPVQPGPGRGKLQEDKGDAAEVFPPSPPPAVLPPSPGASLAKDPAPPRPAPKPLSHSLTSGWKPVNNREVEARTPSSGFQQNQKSGGIHKNGKSQNDKGMCGFCRKPITESERAVEALNRTYHGECFQCRSCSAPLAGKEFYNKAGIPLCEDCHQASLELCWACGEVIKNVVIRALERPYHLNCFTCTTCKQQIGEQRFAQGEVGEVYCLPDYYRKYAPKCGACNQLIIPKEDGTDSYHVQCLGRSYHENCYRCEVCAIRFSPEPNEHGCYPLEGKMLCKSCHMTLVPSQH